MVNYSDFYHLHNKCGQTSTLASHMEVSEPGGGSNQILFAGHSWLEYSVHSCVCVCYRENISFFFFLEK